MDPERKQRDYRSIWLISLIVLIAGVLLTIRPAMIRPLGYILLGVGGVGLVWSLASMDDGKSGREKKQGKNGKKDREVIDDDWTRLN